MYNEIAVSDGIAERLKALRENWEDESGKVKKLSHRELAERINARYGASIHHDTLKFYEAKSGHSKARSNLGMKLETLYFLADFYQVSIDYIVGRDSSPLSDAAKRNVSKLCATPYTGILNALLSSRVLLDVLSSLYQSRLTVRRRVREVMESEQVSEQRLAEIGAEARHLQRDNAEDLEKAIRFVCEYNSLNSAINIKHEKNKAREEAADGEHTED